MEGKILRSIVYTDEICSVSKVIADSSTALTRSQIPTTKRQSLIHCNVVVIIPMTLSYVRLDPIVDISSYTLVRTACQILKKPYCLGIT